MDSNHCKLIIHIIKKYFESQLKYMLCLKWVTCNGKKYQVFSRSNNLCCNKYAKRKMEGNLLFNVWISFFSPSMNILFYIFCLRDAELLWSYNCYEEIVSFIVYFQSCLKNDMHKIFDKSHKHRTIWNNDNLESQ